MTELLSRRLLLRRSDDSDTDLIAALNRRSEVETFIGGLRTERQGSHLFTILRKGTRLGQVALIAPLNTASPEYELVCALLPEAEGCGIATEACLRLLEWSVEELALRRVFGRLHFENLPSAQLIRRLGMEEFKSQDEKGEKLYVKNLSLAT